MAFGEGNTSTEDLNRAELAKLQASGEKIRMETKTVNKKHSELTAKLPHSEIEEKFEEVRADTRRLLQNIRTNTQIGLGDLKGMVSKPENDEERVLKNPKFFLTKVEDYTYFQARVGLKKSQKYYEKANSWGKAKNTDKLSQIQSRNDRDWYQRHTIELICGEKMYNNEELSIYHERVGYSLIKIEDFETDLNTKNIESLNTEGLKNYIIMLEEKHGNEAKKIIKLKIPNLGNGENSEMVRDALKFGGYRAKAIEVVNNGRTVANVKKELKKGRNEIKDPIIKGYINSEISKLRGVNDKEKDWPGKDWSILLLSIVMKQTSVKAKAARGVHNDAQDNLISKIQGNQPNKFIKGFNSETSNYLIKVEDFKNYLKSSNTIITTGNSETDISNPNVVNSMAFGNYVKLIAEKGTPSIKTLLTMFGNNGNAKLNALAEIWNNDSGAKAKTQLEEAGFGNVVDIVKNFSPSAKNRNILDDINKLDDNGLTDALIMIQGNIDLLQANLTEDILEKNPELKGTEKLQDILNQFKEIAESGANGGDMKAMIDNIVTWKAENEINIDESGALKKAAKQAKNIAEKRVTQLKKDLDTAIEKGDQEAIIKIEGESNIAVAYLKRTQKNNVIGSVLTDSDIKDISNGDVTIEEIIEVKKQEDPEFAERMKEYEEPEEKENIIPVPETKEVSNAINTAFTFTRTSGNYNIETPTGEIIEGLTHEEFTTVSTNPEALQNCIDCKAILEECELDYFWENRDLMFTAIGNTNTTGFDIKDNNYMNKAEMKFFLATIVSSIADELGKKSIHLVNSIKSTGSVAEAINMVKEINGAAGMLGTEDANLGTRGNIKGYSFITRKFRDKFIPEDSSQVFNHSKFQDSLRS